MSPYRKGGNEDVGLAIVADRNKEIEQIDSRLRDYSARLNEAAKTWDQFSFSFAPTVWCSECGGRGTSSNGIFGSTECFECHGRTRVPDPRSNALELVAPNFERASKMLDAARETLAQHRAWVRKAQLALYNGERLPAEPTAPLLESTDALEAEIQVQLSKLDNCSRQGEKRPPKRIDRGQQHSLSGGIDDAEVVDDD